MASGSCHAAAAHPPPSRRDQRSKIRFCGSREMGIFEEKRHVWALESSHSSVPRVSDYASVAAVAVRGLPGTQTPPPSCTVCRPPQRLLLRPHSGSHSHLCYTSPPPEPPVNPLPSLGMASVQPPSANSQPTDANMAHSPPHNTTPVSLDRPRSPHS
ncbi:hypothetical protein CPLU01_07161 [Colletotrichum plurivorum]|uniref:Uncharacterized protein n=1 Tax=Colletotrichum plurivorum TaxID=2175906 RepID=A0A8H6NER6_9PEZI|nr:hypothetical protein CPLU01_07161 [Colletotrichum plurivorum]